MICMESLSTLLGQFIANTKYDDLPSDIVVASKERILDILSAATAGSRYWEYNDDIIASMDDIWGDGVATVIGRKEKKPFASAAFINTAFAHAVELDDGHKNAGMHAGAVVVPTALAIGEKMHCSGKDIILSVVLGYELAYRFASNMCPALINNGFHPSAVCGSVGASATAAVLMGLNSTQASNALSLSVLFASGLMEITHSAQASKGAMVGHASFAGILSAVLAKHNFAGPDTIFNVEKGFWSFAAGTVKHDEMIKNLGQDFLIRDTYVKLYPTCRHTHCAIEGIIDLKHQYNINPDDVVKIKIGTFPIAYNLIGRPGHPSNAEEARFSTCYCIAVALLNDSFNLSDLSDDSLHNTAYSRLCNLVSVYIDDEVTAAFPKRRGAKITIVLNNGQVYEKLLYDLKGSPSIPLNICDIRQKFIGASKDILNSQQVENIYTMVSKLETIQNIKDLTALLSTGF